LEENIKLLYIDRNIDLVFMILEAYTALAVIFAAKTIVRKEDMGKNSLFFLAGTMINVTYSIMIGFILRILIDT